MELKPQQSGRTVVLSPAGRIDHTHADAFKAALDPHLRDCVKDGAPLVIDFGQVAYISSAGFRALLVAARLAEVTNGTLALCRPSAEVRRLFDAAKFSDLFEIHASRPEGSIP